MLRDAFPGACAAQLSYLHLTLGLTMRSSSSHGVARRRCHICREFLHLVPSMQSKVVHVQGRAKRWTWRGQGCEHGLLGNQCFAPSLLLSSPTRSPKRVTISAAGMSHPLSPPATSSPHAEDSPWFSAYFQLCLQSQDFLLLVKVTPRVKFEFVNY